MAEWKNLLIGALAFATTCIVALLGVTPWGLIEWASVGLLSMSLAFIGHLYLTHDPSGVLVEKGPQARAARVLVILAAVTWVVGVALFFLRLSLLLFVAVGVSYLLADHLRTRIEAGPVEPPPPDPSVGPQPTPSPPEADP